MDKVKIQVIGDPTFFEKVATEAGRTDRSLSWLIQRCLRMSLPELSKLSPDAGDVEAMKKSPLRNPLRLMSLRFNLALADSDDPDEADLATAPKGTEERMFFLPRDLYETFDAEGERLKLSADEILMWAWERGEDDIKALPSAGA